MTETRNEVRPIHWAVKLLLAVIVGGPFVIGAFFLSSHAFIGISPVVAWTLYIAILVLSTTMVATFLYRRERNSWRRSLLMGIVVGVMASTAIIFLFGGIGAFLEWLVSKIRFV